MGSLLSCALLIGFTAVGSAEVFDSGVMSQVKEITIEVQARTYKSAIRESTEDAKDLSRALERLTRYRQGTDGTACRKEAWATCYLTAWMWVKINASDCGELAPRMFENDKIRQLPPELRDVLKPEYEAWRDEAVRVLDTSRQLGKTLANTPEPPDPKEMTSEEFDGIKRAAFNNFGVYVSQIQTITGQLEDVYGPQFVEPLKTRFAEMNRYSPESEPESRN